VTCWFHKLSGTVEGVQKLMIMAWECWFIF
jgi:hypothetical protein